MKKLLYVFSLMLLFTLFACYSDPVESEVPTDPNLTPDPTEVDPTEDNLLYLTLEQLSEFDGREGRKAYVAVNGDIYDVSNSIYWPNGHHNGHQAGQDLTDAILNESPHGLANLSRVPMIGHIIEDGE
jgi:predicted heme/steroid binding protein